MEKQLHNKFKKIVNESTKYCVFEHEYSINGGVGDFILKHIKKKRLLVVEVKYIDNYSEGKTARVRRNKNRNKVVHQAWRYGKAVKEKYKNYEVVVCIFTNEYGLYKLGVL